MVFDPVGIIVGRLTAAGQPVTSFAASGFREVPLGFNAGCRGIQAHSAGGFDVLAIDANLNIARLTDSGALDASFGGDGIEQGAFPSGTFLITPPPASVVQSNGKVVMAGNSGRSGDFGAVLLTRFTGSPELDEDNTGSGGGLGSDGSGGGGHFGGIALLLLATLSLLRHARSR